MKLIKKNSLLMLKSGDDIIGTSDFELNELLNFPFKISLENCKSIESGCDLDLDYHNYAIGYASEYGHPSPECFSDEQVGRLHGFIDGFQKALELLGDKKFREENLLQDAEWDVEIEMESNLHIGEVADDSYPKEFPTKKPKLDADGCLILKRAE